MPSNMKSFIIHHEFSNYDRRTGERPPGGMERAAEVSRLAFLQKETQQSHKTHFNMQKYVRKD